MLSRAPRAPFSAVTGAGGAWYGSICGRPKSLAAYFRDEVVHAAQLLYAG
jgi:hypothetical protein